MAKDLLEDGVSLYSRGNYVEALTYFLSLPDDSGVDSTELAYYLGLCYSKLKRYDDALLYLEQVVTSAHDSKDEVLRDRVLQCRYLLAVIYCLSGRKKLADYELNKLLETGYKLSSVYASLAYVAWEQDNVQLSLEYYEKALDEDENNPTALNGMGYVLACEDRELTKALSCCKKALEILPDSVACLDSLGWVYCRMGLFDEAKKYLNKAKKADSSNPVILEHLRVAELGEE